MTVELFAGSDPVEPVTPPTAIDRGDTLMDDPVDIAPVETPPLVEVITAPEVVAPVVETPVVETPVVETPVVAPVKNETIMLPKERYDRQKARADKLLLENEELRKQLAQPGQPTPQPAQPELSVAANALNSPLMQDLNKRYNEALLDGNMLESQKLFSEINQRIYEAATTTALNNVKLEQNQSTLKKTLDETADSIAERFPELDDYNADSFDSDLASEVQAISASYIDRGLYSPAEALNIAAEMVMRRVKPEYFTGAPVVAPAGGAMTPEAIAAVAKAAGSQPPSVPAAGVTPPRLDISKMSDEAFAKLTEEELSRLRGDTV